MTRTPRTAPGQRRFAEIEPAFVPGEPGLIKAVRDVSRTQLAGVPRDLDSHYFSEAHRNNVRHDLMGWAIAMRIPGETVEDLSVSAMLSSLMGTRSFECMNGKQVTPAEYLVRFAVSRDQGVTVDELMTDTGLRYTLLTQLLDFAQG